MQGKTMILYATKYLFTFGWRPLVKTQKKRIYHHDTPSCFV